MRWISLRLLVVGLLVAASANESAQAQPRTNHVEFSMFSEAFAVTGSFWGLDVGYRFSERFGAFGALTVVDSVDQTGWMADAGMRMFIGNLSILDFTYEVGIRAGHLNDGTTRVRGLITQRTYVSLERVRPYFEVRFPVPHTFRETQYVWGVAVAIW